LRLLAFAVNSLGFTGFSGLDLAATEADLLSVTLAMGRGRDPLYRVPRDAVHTFSEALVHALEQTTHEPLSLELNHAWRRLYSALELGMQLGSTCTGGRTLELSADEAQAICERALLAQLASVEPHRSPAELGQVHA
jgi:hypothetical protein